MYIAHAEDAQFFSDYVILLLLCL